MRFLALVLILAVAAASASRQSRSTIASAGPYTHPHSFDRLANGHTLATYQFKGERDYAASALVELDNSGHVVRMSDASNTKVDAFIRPYSSKWFRSSTGSSRPARTCFRTIRLATSSGFGG
jgi:hypothetical protein